MPRFFIEPTQIDGDKVTVTGGDAHHIARSLRMAEGETVTVCVSGMSYTCRLTRIRDGEVNAQVISEPLPSTELSAHVHLFMGYPKSDKLETVVQKAVELGIGEITPFISRYCIKRPEPERAKKINLRLCKIADEAAGQSRRTEKATVHLPVDFGRALELAAKAEVVLFCYEGEGTEHIGTVLSRVQNARSVAVFVGSEGGFSPEEALLAQKSGCIMTGLGRRILRCETAALFALSCIACKYDV